MAVHMKLNVLENVVKDKRIVIIDDSIVRGNTMRSAILPMLDRLGPKKIVVASSAPPVKYPDCYGIDMATAGELIAFQALISLLKKKGAQALLEECREGARKALRDGEGAEINWMKKLYDAVPDEELLPEITRLLTPPPSLLGLLPLQATITPVR